MGDYFYEDMNNQKDENTQNDFYGQSSANSQNDFSYKGPVEENPGNGFGIASMVLGIISLACFCIGLNIVLAILAIVFGAIHIGRHKKGGNKGFGIAGIVTGIISIVFGIVFWSMIIFGFKSFYYEPSDLLNDYYDTIEEYIENSDSNNNTF